MRVLAAAPKLRELSVYELQVPGLLDLEGLRPLATSRSLRSLRIGAPSGIDRRDLQAALGNKIAVTIDP